MALAGTLKDFGLADIFQLIGLQKKTGVLHLKGADETVRVYFLEGKIVSADSEKKRLEDLLGTVLVKRGHISQEQLQAALGRQKKTLQRLGHILVNEGLVRQEDLRDALRIQITQVLYRLFRWKDGDYSFHQEETIDFDRENFTPLSPESVLLEGMQMIDEWPIIEKRIRSFDMVFDKVDLQVEMKIEEEGAEGHSILEDDDFDFELTGKGKAKAADETAQSIKLTAHEGRVYQLVDGKQSVQDIMYKGRLTEFETAKILYDLTTRSLIREVAAPGRPRPRKEVSAAAPPSVALSLAGVVLVLALAAVSVWFLPRSPASVLGWALSPGSVVQRFGEDWSKGRLDRIDYALQVYSLSNRSLPPDLSTLVTDRLLGSGEDRDPWGRAYDYTLTERGYTLQGLDSAGNPAESLRVSREAGP